MASSRSKTTTPDPTDEVPEWDMPPTEGDASVAAGREVQPADGAVEPSLDDVMQGLMDWCVAYSEEHAADSAAAMAAEVRRILAGEDAESVLSESAPLNGKEHLEKPFMLHSFSLNPTDFSEGWPFYAAMDATVPGTGDQFVITCGGAKVIAALKRLHELGEYPYPVKIRGKETRKGFTVLQLVVAGA